MSNDVRKRSPKIESIAGCWPMISALLGGTAAMRLAGKTYLPRWPNEEDGFYQNRLSTATLFPAFSRTVEVLSGKPFSRPVTWDEKIVPARIRDMFSDVDLQGTNLHSFLADICEEAMAYGLCGILVEHPPTKTGLTVAQERQQGLRPYLAKVAATSLLDYDSERVNGQETFTLLRFLEVVSERDTVTNTEPMTGGLDAENDAAFRARFVEWIGSLARGTRSAIEYAISTVPGCRSWILTENLTWEGVQKPGYFFAVVDDGTGHPPQTFLDSVSLAIEGYRAFTITYGVFRPNLRNITVSLAVLLADNSHKQSVLRLIEAALRQYVAAMRIGQPLSYTQLIRVAYAASPEVANVTSLYIDGDVGDIYVSPVELIILRTLQVE